MLDHLAVVGGEVRLALGAVHQPGVDAAEVGVHLCPGGEARASQAHDAAVLERLDQAGKVFDFGWRNGGVYALLAVGLYDHRLVGHAVRVVDRADLFDGARHGRKDVCREPCVRMAHQLPNINVLLAFDLRHAWRTNVLLHGQDD